MKSMSVCSPPALALGACTSTQSKASYDTTTARQPSPRAKPIEGSSSYSEADLDLSKRVREAMQSDPMLAACAKAVTVTAHDGAVTLTGQVASFEEMQELETAVRGMSGVQGVENTIQVKFG